MRNKALITLSIIAAAAAGTQAADWAQWGGKGSRNMVSSEKRLPIWFDTSGQPSSVGSGTGVVVWNAKLGVHTYGSPVVSGGKVFVGTTSSAPYDTRRRLRGGGAIVCLDQKSGKCLWQLSIPRYMPKDRMFLFDQLNCGICSTVAVEGNRAYVVSNRDELLCLDTKGQADGNAGPFKDEARYMTAAGDEPTPLCATDGDIVWKVDMIGNKDVDAQPHDAADCSPIIVGNYVFVSPSNGVDRSHNHKAKPNAPSLIAVDKKTGKVVARDRAMAGPKIHHGEWSSPSTGKVGGRNLVFYGGGNGVCYAFDAKPIPPKAGQTIGTLQTVWSFDVSAAAGRKGLYNSKAGPCEIIATPVFYKNRVYVATGQDPLHGKGAAALACIDATKKGDITKTGAKWIFKGINRSISTVAIAGGLLYAADNSGRVFCLDAETGKQYWMHDTKQPICSSPMVADGKVFVGTDKGDLWIYAPGKKLQVYNKLHIGTAVATTLAPANQTLLVASQNYIYAVKAAKKAK